MKIIDRIIGFLKRFIPYYAIHIVVCSCIVIFDVSKDDFMNYYHPLVIMAVIAVVPAIFSYYVFFSDDKKYDISMLDNFDRNMICKRFGGKYAGILRRAVIDMHVYHFYNDALDALRELKDKPLKDEQRAVLCYYLGDCYFLMFYPSNGAKYLEQAIELNLDEDYAYILLARCYVAMGRFDDAMTYYNIALERETYFDYIYTDIGIAYIKKGDGDSALEYFQKSIDEGKAYGIALSGLSLAYLLKKDLEKSREYFQMALRTDFAGWDGFKRYYCDVAESVDMLDKIDENMKLSSYNYDKE